MQNAGFVDIQYRVKKVFYGDWSPEIDPQMAPFWRQRKNIYSRTLEPVVLTCFKREFPDLRIRERFARDALHDFLSHDYPMYTNMYLPF